MESNQIVQKFNDKYNRMNELRDRFDLDYGLYRLKEYKLEGSYECVTANDARTLADKVVDSLAYCPLNINIPALDSKKKERKDKELGEKAIYGVLNLADSRLSSFLQPGIQQLLSWYSVIRGWYGIIVFLHKNDKDEFVADIRVIDIYNTVWEIDDEGFAWMIQRKKISPTTAERYGVDLPKGASYAYQYDFFDREVNQIVTVGKGQANPITNKHDLGRVPGMITMCGATPFVDSDMYFDTIKDMGESIYAADRSLYPIKHRLLTLYMTIVAQGAHNPLAIKSAGGRKGFSRSPYYPGSIVKLDINKGEDVQEFYKPQMPKDTQYLLGEFMKQISMGGLSPIAHGHVDTALPGYGIHLLTHNTGSVLEPRRYAIEKGLNFIAREILLQVKDEGLPRMRLHGRTGTEEAFDMELKGSEIKGDWFPESKLEPKLPENETEKYATAQQAVVNNLLSRRTTRSGILKVRDAEQEEQRILEEQAEDMPAIKMMKIQRSLREAGEDELAMALPMMQQLLQGGKQPGPVGLGPGGESIEGERNPEYAQGVRPETGITPQRAGSEMKPETDRNVEENNRLAQLGMVRGR